MKEISSCSSLTFFRLLTLIASGLLCCHLGSSREGIFPSILNFSSVALESWMPQGELTSNVE